MNLVRRECPSLQTVPAEYITLRLRFDDSSVTAVRGVKFRVLPEAWPAAITDNLPLVHVDANVRPRINQVEEEKGRKTWEDLVREGALLGV